MRHLLAEELHKQMTLDNNVVLINCDLGYKMWDRIEKDYPKRYLNVGASEFAGMDIAVGMALEGKKVFIYSISTFLIYRAFEVIKLYLDGEKIPVIMIGSGRDKDYSHDGPSHDCTDIKKVLDILPNIKQYYPETSEEIPQLLNNVIKEAQPAFISLRR